MEWDMTKPSDHFQEGVAHTFHKCYHTPGSLSPNIRNHSFQLDGQLYSGYFKLGNQGHGNTFKELYNHLLFYQVQKTF